MISALFFGSGVMLACIIYYSYYLVKSFGYKGSDYQLNTQKKYSQVLSDKGAYGEYLTYKYLKRITPTGFFLFNVYIPKKSGGTAELDIIFIHQSGIYVFESKNYSGIIYGQETQKTWTQVLSGGGKKSKNLFLNPIIQNEGHIKWLKALLADVPSNTFQSCIVFSDHCTLMDAYTSTGGIKVLHRHSVFVYVDEIARKVGTVLSSEHMTEIYNKLKPYSNVNEKIKQKHRSAIKRMNGDEDVQSSSDRSKPERLQSETQYNISNEAKICPECGRAMLLRTPKRGPNVGHQFLSCSGFPNCMYIENVEIQQTIHSEE